MPAHSIGSKAYSVHLSFVHFTMGSPYGSSVVFLPLDRNEVLLDNWSVFLQDGVTLFESDSDDLILIEGITSVGLLEVLFPDRPRDVWSSCGRSVGSEVGGFLHIQLSSLLVRTLSVSLSPNNGVGLGLSSAGPVASRPSPWGSVSFGCLVVFLSPGRFLARLSRAWRLARDSSGSRTSREEALACIQGASDSLRHSPSRG